jgi:hypothetical protein
MWNLIKELEDLMAFFPYYEDKQLSPRTYMFGILETVRNNKLENFIKTQEQKDLSKTEWKKID